MTRLKENEGYILRIASGQWIEQVFNSAMYYSGLRRKWKPEQTILFLHKTNNGDAFIGYGIIEKTHDENELSKEEQLECEKHGWKTAIVFKYVVEFKHPLRLKETIFKDSKLRGRCFHGLPLNKEKADSILALAERLQPKTDQKS